MSFRTTLFRALAAADVAHCNGLPVTAKLLEHGTGIEPFVCLADDTSLTIRDDEIVIDASGRAYTERDGAPVAIVWTFQAMQPLTAACVEPTTPAAPRRIANVLSRVRQLDALMRE